MGTYPIKERAKDLAIRSTHYVMGAGYIVTRLLSDGFKEAEAEIIHSIDKGCDKRMIKLTRALSYRRRMNDIQQRINQTKEVIADTYTEVTQAGDEPDLAGLMEEMPFMLTHQ